MKNIPALLLGADLKRKLAKQEVEKAIETIKKLGPIAGISGRTIYEYGVLAAFMEKEITREPQRKEDLVGSSEER